MFTGLQATYINKMKCVNTKIKQGPGPVRWYSGQRHLPPSQMNNAWDPHGRKRELAPRRCPLASTGICCGRNCHNHPKTNKCNKQDHCISLTILHRVINKTEIE